MCYRIVYRLALWAAAGLAGCAITKAPTGGPLDKQGPKLERVDPPQATTQFAARRITFTFDEFLLPTVALSREVNVSPPPSKAPRSYILNKTIVVELQGELQPNTTYSITLGTGIKDNTEKNALTQPIQYAFSTGSYLDSGAVAGQVVFPYTGRGEGGFTVGLYHPDSVPGNSYWKVRPQYVGRSDSLGNYLIGYVRPARYVLFGFKDSDGSFSYSSASEKVAYDVEDTLDLTRQLRIDGRDIYSYLPDTLGPRPRDVEAIHPHLVVLTFNEPVLAGTLRLGTDSVCWGYGDTRYHYLGDASKVMLHLRDSLRADTLSFRLIGLADTLGNRADSTLRRYVKVNPRSSMPLTITPAETADDIYRFAFYTNAPIDTQRLRQHLSIRDTAKLAIPYTLQLNGPYQFSVLLPPTVDSLNSYRLTIDSNLVSTDGLPVAKKGYATILKLGNPDNYGSLQGSIRAADDNVILTLVAGKQRYTQRGRQFRFGYVRPGEYSLYVLLDEDGNRRWTAGRIRPKRYSEEVRYLTEKVRIRAGFSIEQYLVSVED